MAETLVPKTHSFKKNIFNFWNYNTVTSFYPFVYPIFHCTAFPPPHCSLTNSWLLFLSLLLYFCECDLLFPWADIRVNHCETIYYSSPPPLAVHKDAIFSHVKLICRNRHHFPCLILLFSSAPPLQFNINYKKSHLQNNEWWSLWLWRECCHMMVHPGS